MGTDLTFRLIYAALLVTLLVTVRRSRHSSLAERKPDTSKEPRLIFYAMRGLGLGITLYSLLYIIYPPPLAWSFVPFPAALRWAGAVLVLATIPVIAWTQRTLGRNVSTSVTTWPDHELVTHGPYHWVRNPLYSEGAVVYAGLGLVASSWLLLLAAPVALGLVGLRLPLEEAELEARFGERWREYAGRTGRFLPRLRRRHGG